MSRSVVANNLARGGDLGDGLGDGLGGGIAVGSLDSFFGELGTLDISRSLLKRNRAEGGAGGDGLGGGIFDPGGGGSEGGNRSNLHAREASTIGGLVNSGCHPDTCRVHPVSTRAVSGSAVD